MGYEAQEVGNVKGLGRIFRADAPLDKQMEAFERAGITSPFLASPDEIAQIRLAGVSDDYSRTNMMPIALKGARTILFRDSALMNPLTASEAVRAHADGQYLTRKEVLYEIAEATAREEEGLEPEDRTVLIVSQEGNFDLTPEMDDSRFIFRRQTQEYFAKKTKGIIPFFSLSGQSKSKTNPNYLWFDDPQNGSSLVCWSRGLGDDDRAFAVLRTAEGSAQKNRYTLTEVEKANSETIQEVFQTAGIPALIRMVSKQLTEGLLEKLRKGKQ